MQDIYYAENQIIKALPEMIDKATNRELSAAFKSTSRKPNNQVKRLDQVFALIGHEPKGIECPAINGIIDEANEVAGEVDEQEGPRCSPSRCRAGGRALRDHALWNTDRLGRAAGHGDVVGPAQRRLEPEGRRQTLTALPKAASTGAHPASHAQGAGAPRRC